MGEIRLAAAGSGHAHAPLAQGLEYYKHASTARLSRLSPALVHLTTVLGPLGLAPAPGVVHQRIGGHTLVAS